MGNIRYILSLLTSIGQMSCIKIDKTVAQRTGNDAMLLIAIKFRNICSNDHGQKINIAKSRQGQGEDPLANRPNSR